MITLNWVKASVECEGCGKPFVVCLDPGDLSPGEDLHDLAREAVLNGNKVDGDIFDAHFSSYQCDMALCPSCTKVADDIETDGDMQPSRDQLIAGLEAALAKR